LPENIKVEHVVCCICDVEDSEVVFDLGEIKIVKCNRCGLVYNNPRYSKNSIEKYYRDHYYPEDILSNTKKAFEVLEGNRHIWEKCILQIEHFGARKGKLQRKLLDVGCGLGFFPRVAVEHGWDVIGLEPDTVAAAFARSNFNLKIVTGTLEKLLINERSQSFDVITYLQCFEHLSNPVAELDKVTYLLKPGGILFLAVPNFRHLMVKILRKNQFNVRNPTHMYHYTYNPLCRLLKKSGFKNIERLVYWGGGMKRFGVVGQTIQWLSRAGGISSEIRVIATL
jgi:2-polyprenyl-3-methyl-5-hydroxy-6-metoxy-1,4-benzoquinol methylase